MFLSIVICNYNYGRFLDRAIQSAVEQTYVEKEVIVIDDGSTDESPSIVERWQKSARIAAFFQRNEGQLSVYNRGFQRARGDVIIFLDSDDTLDAFAGERIVAEFAAPNVVKVHFRLALVDAEDRPLGGFIPRRLSDGDLSHYLRRGLLYASSPGSGNAYRRDALARLMPLPVSPTDPHGADFFALHGIALLGPVRRIEPGTLGTYRVHVGEATKTLVFGNARHKEEASTAEDRYARLQRWLVERLGPEFSIPDEFVDFSIQKLVFADRVFACVAYWEGLCSGSAYLVTKLARAIWNRSTSPAERVGLLGWAIAVVVLPRPLGRRIARYVCNPASRNLGAYTGDPAT